MQSIGSGPSVAGDIDSAITAFNLGIDAGVHPRKLDAFVFVVVIDLIRGIARTAKCSADDAVRVTQMLHRIADQAAHLHWADAITSDNLMIVVHISGAVESWVRTPRAGLAVRATVGTGVDGEHHSDG